MAATGPAEGGRKVLIAIDGNDHSKAAFNWFMEHVYRKEDFIILTHIPETPDLPSLSFKQDGLHVPFEEWKRMMEDNINKVQKMQADYEHELISRKVHYKITGEHQKNVGEAIIQEAEKESADLIVLGTRGLGTFRRAIVGSVSDYVAHNGVKPILIIPNKAVE